MRASLLLSIVAAVTGICISMQPVSAQLQPLTSKGRILGIDGFFVTIQGEAGPMVGTLDPARRDAGVAVQNMPLPKIEITGTTSLNALEKGVMVRFNVELDNRKAVGEVSELTIVGLEGWGEATPGLHPEGAPPMPGNPNAKQPPAVTGKFLAIGTITSYKAGVLNLSYGGRAATVQVKVSESAQVKLESKDPRMIRVGDMAAMEGASHRPGRMFVGTLTIQRDVNLDKPAKPGPKAKPEADPFASKPERKPMKGPEKVAPNVAEKPVPMPMPEGPARPKTKGKVTTIN